MGEIIQNPRKIRSRVVIMVFSTITLMLGLSAHAGVILKYFNCFLSGCSLTADACINFITVLLNAIIVALPCILLILYAIFLYKKFTSRIILATAFFALLYPALYEIVYLIFNYHIIFEELSALAIIKYFVEKVLINIIPQLLTLVSFILALRAVKGKAFYIVSLAFSLITPIGWLLIWSKDFLFSLFKTENILEIWPYYLGRPLSALAFIALITTTMIFVIANSHLIEKEKIKPSKPAEVINTYKVNPSTEEALVVLNDKFYAGEIGENEYREQRENIIKKL